MTSTAKRGRARPGCGVNRSVRAGSRRRPSGRGVGRHHLPTGETSQPGAEGASSLQRDLRRRLRATNWSSCRRGRRGESLLDVAAAVRPPRNDALYAGTRSRSARSPRTTRRTRSRPRPAGLLAERAGRRFADRGIAVAFASVVKIGQSCSFLRRPRRALAYASRHRGLRAPMSVPLGRHRVFGELLNTLRAAFGGSIWWVLGGRRSQMATALCGVVPRGGSRSSLFAKHT